MFSIFSLSALIYNLLSLKLFRNLANKYGFLKNSRKDYYECGFRPISQKPIKISIQYLLLTLFFLTYDIELTLVVPAASSFIHLTGLESALLMAFIFFFVISFLIDYDRHALTWQI